MSTSERRRTRVASTLVVGVLTAACTATGTVDWSKVAQVAGTIFQVVAQNYTGPYADSIAAIVSAFTGSDIVRPSPGAYESPNDQVAAYLDRQVGPVQTASDGTTRQIWGEPMPARGPRAAGRDDALSIDFGIVKLVPGGMTLVTDGDVLRDGVGRPEAGDRFGIMFTTNAPAYVYITNIDATGWGQTLFPYPGVSGYENPVQPGAQVLLPGSQLYALDDARGVETILVLVSREPKPEVESAIAPLRGKERTAYAASRGAAARVGTPLSGQRGLLGISPGDTEAGVVALDRYIAKPGVREFAFSRWFSHD